MKANRNRQKLIIKIFSVLAAIVLWLFVCYTEDKLLDVNVNSIEIQYVGEQTLYNKGLMLTDKDSLPKASVKIRGRRSDLISVMGGVGAKIDLSQIDSAGTHKMSPTFNIPSSAVYISKINTQNIELNIEKTVEKIIDVKVIQQNASKNKSYIVESVAEIKQMKIVGENNDINSIESACLYVDVSSVLSEEELIIKPVFETGDGKTVTPKNRVFTDVSEIKVTNKVYDKKSVGVVVELPRQNTDKYIFDLVYQSIQEVEVGVVDDNIKVDFLKASFDDTSVFEMGKQQYVLELSVPEGVYVPENSRFIEVEIDIIEKVKQEVNVPVTVNNATGKNYQLKSGNVLVMISGPKDKLLSENVTAELDLLNLEAEGEEKRVKLNISSKDEDVKIESKTVYVDVIVG